MALIRDADTGYIIDTGYDEDIDTGARRARPKARNVRQGIPGRNALVLPNQPRAFASAVPGVPTPGRRVRPMGLGTVSFILNSGTLLTMTQQCQKPFAPERLFISIARNGTSAATPAVTVQSVKIGSDEQLINPGVPVEMFAAQAYDVDIEFDEAAAGLTVAIQFLISAPITTTDSLVVSGALHGVTLG